jgi:hypothetical protein
MKDKAIIIKVSAIEKALIKEKADALGTTMSDYLRLMALNGSLKVDNKKARNE